jgi:hypothetical protein
MKHGTSCIGKAESDILQHHYGGGQEAGQYNTSGMV